MRVYSFGYMFVATTSKSQVPSTAASVILLFVLTRQRLLNFCTMIGSCCHRRSHALQVLVSDPATPYDVITEVCCRPVLLPRAAFSHDAVDVGSHSRGESFGGA